MIVCIYIAKADTEQQRLEHSAGHSELLRGAFTVLSSGSAALAGIFSNSLCLWLQDFSNVIHTFTQSHSDY